MAQKLYRVQGLEKTFTSKAEAIRQAKNLAAAVYLCNGGKKREAAIMVYEVEAES